MVLSRVCIFLLFLHVSINLEAQPDGNSELTRAQLEEQLQNCRVEQKVLLLNRLSGLSRNTDIVRSRQYADSAFKLALVLKDSLGIVHALSNKGEIHVALHQHDSAIRLFEKAVYLADEQNQDSILAEIYVKSGSAYLEMNNFPEALGLFQLSAQIFEKIGYQHDLSYSLLLIGSTYHVMNDYTLAMRSFFEALDRNPPGEKKLKADILNNIGVVYFDLGSYETALEYYLKSLDLVEELNDKSGTANALNNIGIVYYEWKNMEKALEYYQKSMRLEEELDNEQGVADSYNNIGIIYSDWDQNELAISYYEKALEIYKRYNNWEGEANIKNNIGESMADLSKYDEAHKFLSESLAIELKLGKGTGLAQSYFAIAEVYYSMNDYTRALENNNLSYAIADSIGLNNIKMDNAELFYKIYEKKGNYGNSLQYFKLFKTLEDSIYTDRLIRKITDLQLKYEMEQKENDKIFRQEQFIEKQASIRTQRIYLILIILLIIISGSWIYYAYRRKKQTTRALNSFERQFNLQKEKLIKMNDELRLFEAQHNALLENSLTGILLLDTHGNILEVNDKMLQILGSPGADETKSINCLEYQPLKNIGLSQKLKECIQTGKSIRCESDYKTKWGKTVQLVCCITPLMDQHERVYKLILNIEDISQSISIERSRQQSEEKYRILVENSLQAMLIVQEGKVIFANPKVEELLHYSIDEIKNSGRRWLNLIIHPDDKKRSFENVRDALSGKVVKSRETYKIIRKDNTERIIETLSSVVDYMEKPAMLIVAIDITERTEAQNKLLKSEENLKAANAMKDKFFSIIAHDLKNPFSSILGFSNLLREAYDNFSEGQRKAFINDICESSENTYKLLQNLLEWSRTQTDNIEFNPVILEVKPIVMDNLEMLKSAFENKNISYEAEIQDQTSVFADENMFKLVIRNLLSNALKFTHRGGQVFIKSTMDENRTIIVVSDTGIGIREEDLGSLFRIDEHFKIEGTDQEKGTGLGLILSKEFVEKNNGEIQVSSVYGKGSSFQLTFPAKQNSAPTLENS